MKTYIGTKVIKAKTMTKLEYCKYRGWEVPANEDPTEEVYLVEYEEDANSPSNHPDHKGYISMSPKHVFEKAYKPAETYKDRLLIERDDLEVKFLKLKNALDKDLVPQQSVSTLTEQFHIMEQYLEILNKRLR